MQDLFSFIQGHARKKREDLACEVLALLFREEAGQRALQNLLDGMCSKDRLIRVQTRKMFADGCVPDITLMQQGGVVALLELKFWASLTARQLSGAYCQLAPFLFFIVPQQRVSSFQEVIAQLGAEYRVIVRSWNELLDQLESVVNGDTKDGRLFIGALGHLKEFCKVIEKEQFAPFTNEQLEKPVLDDERHLVWITEQVIASAAQAEIIDKARKLQAARDSYFYYGQRAYMGGFSCWLGYWPEAWKWSPTDGPLWVQFTGRAAFQLEMSGRFADGIPVLNNSLCFPLFKPENIAAANLQEEIDRVMNSLKMLADRLLLEAGRTLSKAPL